MDDAEITRKNIEFFRSSGSHSLLELQIKSTKAQIRSLARSRFIQYKQFNVCVFIYGINAGVRGKKTIIRYEDCEREKNVYKMEEKRWKDIKSADDRTKRETEGREERKNTQNMPSSLLSVMDTSLKYPLVTYGWSTAMATVLLFTRCVFVVFSLLYIVMCAILFLLVTQLCAETAQI